MVGLDEDCASVSRHLWEEADLVLDVLQIICHLFFDHKLLKLLLGGDLGIQNENRLSLSFPFFLRDLLEKQETEHFYKL